MKFSVPVACSSCGCDFSALGYAEQKFPAAACPECGAQIHILNPLSISVVAERLLYRSQREIAESDYTLSVICSAIAVESAYSSLPKMEGNRASEAERLSGYRRRTRRLGTGVP